MIRERLEKVMSEGNLTPSDLQRWFDRPMSTVHDWLKGAKVGGPPGDVAEVLWLLGVLEQKVKTKDGFPLPGRGGRTQRSWRIRRIREMRESVVR
jgi:hypothetical protein